MLDVSVENEYVGYVFFFFFHFLKMTEMGLNALQKYGGEKRLKTEKSFPSNLVNLKLMQ